jgi:hypothetical protein
VDLTGLARATAAPEPAAATPMTATVVRTDESGLWVVPAGDDPQHPVGPCRGGWTANGTRVPPGALVALIDTPDGPWAIGVDNPALAIADGTLAPFLNPSFELITAEDPPQPQGWGGFGLFGDVSSGEVITAGGAAHGQRHWRITKNGAGGVFLQSTSWTVLAGSNLEVSHYGRRVSGQPRVTAYLYSCPPGAGDPGLFNPNAVLTPGNIQTPTDDWLRYRDIITPPPTHTRLAVLLRVDSADGNPVVVDLDNVDADLVEIDATAVHQDFMRRIGSTMAGGGIRQVTTGGNVSWSQPFTLGGAGLKADEAPDGRFEIAQPANGTVLPVHSSSARTSHTVAGGVIAMNPEDALWYELPLGSPATSPAGRFHIVGTTTGDGFDPPPHWILILRRTTWSSTSFAPEYLWGDGRAQDPWRTPTFNAGWAAGTIAPAFTKTHDGDVVLRGRVKSGTGSAFTLPPGYWPAVTHSDFVRDGSGASALITISTTGTVTTSGSNTDHSIETRFQAGP